jgi:hypothetical protein
MASVKHPCCTQLLAVCLASEMMLVTQLMPYGSLLEYVRKNQGSIGSRTMLNWCTQIARVSCLNLVIKIFCVFRIIR